MTRKDFITVAQILNAANLPDVPEINQQTRILALSFCDVFQRDNPRFDRARFLKACGVTP